MNADERRYKHQELSRRVIGVFFDVYNVLGFGFLESVYQESLAIALTEAGLRVEKGVRATEIEVGLLLNFGPKPEVKRFAFDNHRKQISVHLRSSAANNQEGAG